MFCSAFQVAISRLCSCLFFFSTPFSAKSRFWTVVLVIVQATKQLFFLPAPFWPHEGPLVQSCFAGQLPGTDCLYTGQSPHVFEVGKL